MDHFYEPYMGVTKMGAGECLQLTTMLDQATKNVIYQLSSGIFEKMIKFKMILAFQLKF